MAGGKFLSGRVLMGCTGAVLFAAAALILWLPAADSRAYDRLSKIKVGRCQWEGARFDVVYADLHDRLEKRGEGHTLVIAEGVDLRASTWTMSLELDENTTAAEYARCIAVLSGLALYTTPSRVIVDYEGKDHRTWLKKAQDWFKDLPERRWFEKEPSDPFANPFKTSPYSL
jgi:hypothetical protein